MFNEKLKGKIKPPRNCPVCKSNVFKEKDEAILRCSNKYDCSSQKIGRIIHFVSKKSLNIDGFGEKQAKQLLINGFLKDILENVSNAQIREFLENTLEEQIHGY